MKKILLASLVLWSAMACGDNNGSINSDETVTDSAMNNEGINSGGTGMDSGIMTDTSQINTSDSEAGMPPKGAVPDSLPNSRH